VAAGLLVLILGASCVLVAGCSGDKRHVDSITVSGSTTILPIAEQAAEDFQKQHADTSILVSGMGSSAGIEAVGVTHTADIGTTSRELKDDETQLDLDMIPIANDGIAVIVHPDNPINGLSTNEIRQIFAGRITNWSQVGGADIPITLINRDEASGTRDAFATTIMQNAPFEIDAVVLPGTGQVREVVTRTPGAIGYISVGFVAPRFVDTPVKALIVDGIEPTEENIATGRYPLSRKLYFLMPKHPSILAEQYLQYVLSSEVQEGAVRDAGFLPVISGNLNLPTGSTSQSSGDK
jgi:phosphate transport system substrate-binding protein